jgi:hypothetical protein
VSIAIQNAEMILFPISKPEGIAFPLIKTGARHTKPAAGAILEVVRTINEITEDND